jgi:hypothetical protein
MDRRMDSIVLERQEEKESFLLQDSGTEPVSRKAGLKKNIWSYSRIAVEALLAVSTILLLLRQRSSRPDTHLLKTPVPVRKSCLPVLWYQREGCLTFLASIVVPRQIVKFMPNETLVNEHMFADEHTTLHTLHKWIPLSSGMLATGSSMLKPTC